MSTTTTTQTTSSHIQPRRRAAPGSDLPSSQSKPTCPTPSDVSVRKGSTFHSPKDPPSPLTDPILNIKSLPLRSVTSPDALQQLCDESDKRVDELLSTFNKTLSDLGSALETDHSHQNKLPVPRSLATNAASKSNLMEVAGTRSTRSQTQAPSANASIKAKQSVYTPHKRRDEVNDKEIDNTGHVLSDYAAKVIKLHVIDPILKEKDLEAFHDLVKGVPHRINNKQITCLRDLEKTLIFLAPVSTNLSTAGENILAHCFLSAKTKSRSPAAYLDFCEVSIQCIHTTVGHLNEIDQRRPTDRPYTNNYFVDLVEQVRAYARIMARTRAKKAKGLPLDETDIQESVPTVTYESSDGDPVLTLHTRGEKITLSGGLSEDGNPAELVRERDGTIIAIDEGHYEDDEMLDTDVMRSMARKRKCDIGKVEYHACRECGKVYTRPCDLTKHEKTHSRPWKCSDETCKYYEMGWPTEKERDRHVNDKHSNAPALYRCLYKPCPYTSKRESNCKQHMEKAHGWDYIRSKSRKGTKLIATVASPSASTSLMPPTPGSDRLSTPGSSSNSHSPMSSSYNDFSPVPTLEPGMASSRGSVDSGLPSSAYAPTPSPISSGAPDFDFNDYSKDAFTYSGYISPSYSDGRQPSENAGMTPLSDVHGAGPSGVNASFEENFNFNNELTYNWAGMNEIFPQYTFPPHQEPTPASDFNFDFSVEKPADGAAGTMLPELSPNGSADHTLFGSETQDVAMSSQSFVDFAGQAKAGAQEPHNDFTLFTSAMPAATVGSGEVETMTMFPDMPNPTTGPDGDTNMMFSEMSEEEMDRYLYGDGSPVSSSGYGEI